MATRFTRVTVAAADRQVDVSLPAGSPLGEQLPMVLRLLSIPPSATPRRWVLSTPELGIIARTSSLDESGVLDGMVLHLTEAEDAALPPFVDDVESAAAEAAGAVPAFREGDRRSAVAGLLAVVTVALAGTALLSPAPVDWIAAALAVIAALVVGGVFPAPGATVAALTAVPGALALVAVLDPAALSGGVATMVGVFAGSLAVAAAGLVRRMPVAVSGGVVAALFAAVGWVAAGAGLQGYRTAGLVLVLAVVIAGLAGQVALGGAGLVNLLVADERGEKVPRAAVETAVRRGTAIATGMVWASGVAAALACTVLLLAVPGPEVPGWSAPAVGALGGLVFALRSRMFSRVRQVVPMLLVPVVAASVAALRLPGWLAVADPATAAGITVGALVVIGVVVAVTGAATLAEVPRMRLRRSWEGLEFLAVLALLPGMLLLFDTVDAIRRWMG